MPNANNLPASRSTASLISSNVSSFPSKTSAVSLEKAALVFEASLSCPFLHLQIKGILEIGQSLDHVFL